MFNLIPGFGAGRLGSLRSPKASDVNGREFARRKIWIEELLPHYNKTSGRHLIAPYDF